MTLPPDEDDIVSGLDAEQARRAWLRWGTHGWQWRHWLRRSPRAIALFDWLNEPDKYTVLLGRNGYRLQVLALLAGAVADDCAAAGMRIEGRQASVVSDTLAFSVHFSPLGGHRAVAWREGSWPAAHAWVDGNVIATAAGAPLEVDPPGHWVDERYYCIAVAGPRDHPLQDFAAFGQYLGSILGLLVWDAQQGRLHSVQQPGPDERWTRPTAELRDGALLIHADASTDARTGTRTTAITDTPPARRVPL